MPARWIKDALKDSDRFNACCPAARDLWLRLTLSADDYGRMDGRASVVFTRCYPVTTFANNCPQSADRCFQLLHELERADLVRFYEDDGKPYLFLTNWYERPRSKSKYAEPKQELTNKKSRVISESVCKCSQVAGNCALSTSTTHDHGTRTTVHDHGQKTDAGGKPPATEKLRAETADTWKAYGDAYQERYGTPPARNATVNGQMAQFVKRIGVEESPPVAAFYLTHQDAFYVKKMHPVGMLLADAEKLRTEWATQRQMTGGAARAIERKAVTASAANELLKEIGAINAQ